MWRSEGRVIVSTTAAAVPDAYRGTDKLIFGIVVLAVITFWLFAQTTLNVAPTMRDALWISESLINIAVSITVPKDDRRGSVNV